MKPSLIEAHLEPSGFQCRFEQLEPGLFAYGAEVCFLSEYGDAFVVASGEQFWGGTDTAAKRAKLVVLPLAVVVRTMEHGE